MTLKVNFQTWNQLTTGLFFEELARQGLTDVFVAPGSRSTPLVLAAAQNKKIKIHTHYDERGLAYFALGCAKSSARPTAVITTSGTAVSNLLPAVTEAFYGKVPLLILSADRPFELIDVGANQAIQQKDIFQNAVHDFFDIPPANEKTNLENLLSLAGHAYTTALNKRGPLHLNFHFQEPLAPAGINEALPANAKKYYESQKPFTIFPKIAHEGSTFDFNIASFKKPLVIFGSYSTHAEADTCLQLAQHLKAPVLCDVQNPLRFRNFNENIFYYDLLLDTVEFSEKPDVILHFGGPLTSKRLSQYIEKFDGSYVQIHPWAQRLDPTHKQKTLISATICEFFHHVQKQNIASSPLLSLWKEKSFAIGKILEQEFSHSLTEINIFHHLANTEANYFVGSSMPIRDLERFTGASKGTYSFNRGASGIDGNIATTAGLSLYSKTKNICMVGDQAFLYDMNSLALHRQLSKPLHTIVINNAGGGIFSFLPVKNIENQDFFQKFFTNPQEWNLAGVAQTFGLHYFQVKTSPELFKALEQNQSTLIEIKSDIDANIREHRALTEKIRNLLGQRQ